MKKTFKYYFLTILLSFVFMQGNPWILTTEEKPKNESKIMVSLGSGSGGHDSEDLTSFKYAFLLQSSNRPIGDGPI